MVRAAGSGVLDFGHGLTLDRTSLGQVTATRAAGLLLDNVSRTALPNAAGKSIDRIWTVETTTAPAAAVPVTLQWPAAADNGLNSFSPAQAWRSPVPVVAWAPGGSAQNATVTTPNRSFSFATAALGRLTVSSAPTPLPVELTRFTAEATGADALLRWATASEKNNDRFEVEASPDGRTSRRIGTVAGHGSSSQPHQYQLLDPSLARYAARLVYYRLRQVDMDSTASYSLVRTVQVAEEKMSFAVTAFSNPYGSTGTRLLVRTTQPGPLTLTAYDLAGRRLFARSVVLPTGATTLDLPEAARLPVGLYYVQATQAGQHAVLKLLRE